VKNNIRDLKIENFDKDFYISRTSFVKKRYMKSNSVDLERRKTFWMHLQETNSIIPKQNI